MSKSPYRTNGKMVTFGQYLKMKQEEKERAEQPQEKLVKITKPGRCPLCDSVKFSHRCEPGKLIRMCKNPECGDEQIF